MKCNKKCDKKSKTKIREDDSCLEWNELMRCSRFLQGKAGGVEGLISHSTQNILVVYFLHSHLLRGFYELSTFPSVSVPRNIYHKTRKTMMFLGISLKKKAGTLCLHTLFYKGQAFSSHMQTKSVWLVIESESFLQKTSSTDRKIKDFQATSAIFSCNKNIVEKLLFLLLRRKKSHIT